MPLGEVTTETLLKFLHACREAKVPGRRSGPNVVTLSGRRMDQYVATTLGVLRAAREQHMKESEITTGLD